MKIEVLLVALSLNVTINLGAQGYVAFNNLSPATGLVYLFSEIPGGRLLNEDVNFQLLGGADPFNLQPIRTWLLSDGTANGITVAPGRFADPSHNLFAIPGTQPGGNAFLAVRAWTGNFNDWEAAVRVGAAGATGNFWNPVGTAGSAVGLTGMESFIIGIPEPSSLAVLYCGALLLAARRCRVRPR
ncbi:MAG: hypothetical protein IT541_13080 [Hyphomicrobiales bacterium]|nr:hypothetical protein [Hyphomicrobiales bacterium]